MDRIKGMDRMQSKALNGNQIKKKEVVHSKGIKGILFKAVNMIQSKKKKMVHFKGRKRILSTSHFVLLSLFSISFGFLLGCARVPCPTTPEEEAAYKEAEEQRVQEMLSETAPRNKNPMQPKAVPEFRTRIPGFFGGN